MKFQKFQLLVLQFSPNPCKIAIFYEKKASLWLLFAFLKHNSGYIEFGLRPHSSNGVNGDHNGDLALDAEEEDGGDYLEEDPDDGTAASKPANGSSLTDKLSSAKAALLNFRLPTATELKNNYINSNFHKSLNQPLVVKTRVEPPEVQKSRQVK